MAEAAPEAIQALASFIKLGADDQPYLEGVKCAACGEVMALETRRACPKCAAIDRLEPIRLAARGRLYAYTVVHRSFPGVKTPFVAALVDLDGGGSIKGNLEGVDPDAVAFDMPLTVEFERFDAPGAGGGRCVRHVFRPAAN
jgi:uncharacterized OB-fold protein